MKKVHSMKKLTIRTVLPIFSLMFLSLLCLGGQAFADENLPNTPQDIVSRQTPVIVEFDGNDGIGSRLSTRIKESFNNSNLFILEDDDVPKFRVLISSVPEFETRPNVGSAYCVVWTFSVSDSTLRHYLAREVGVTTAEGVNDLAAKILEKTDTLAARYDYLFPDN